MPQASLLLPRLIGLLSTPAVQRIKFRLGPYPVRGWDYTAISKELLYGRIAIKIDPSQLQKLNAAAAYIDKTFIFPSIGFGSTLVEKIHVVHESTHAVNEMHGFRWGATDSGDEATAHLAGALYCYYAAGSLQRELSPDPIFAVTTEPFKTALDIANRLHRSDDIVVPARDAIALRTKVVECPAYAALGITLGTLP